jgi:hypothetical protein
MAFLFVFLLQPAQAGVFSDLCARYLVVDCFDGESDEFLSREAAQLEIKAKWHRLDAAGWRRLKSIEAELESRARVNDLVRAHHQ